MDELGQMEGKKCKEDGGSRWIKEDKKVNEKKRLRQDVS